STCKWNFTSNGKSSSDPHHVRLCDTDLEKPLWILLIKSAIFKDPTKSAQSATTFGLVLPSSVIPAPNPLLVSIFSVYVYFFIFLFSSVLQYVYGVVT